MANCLLVWPNYADPSAVYSPALSGGSWQAALPLTNLQDRRLWKPARSTDATTPNTQFDIDLGVARAVRVIAIPKHNLSQSATIRCRGYSGAGHSGLVYDSTALSVWPTVFPSNVLPTGHPSAGTLKYTAEDFPNVNIGYTLAIATAQTARYWLIEVNDTGNAAGYVDLGRLWIGLAYQPSVNFAYNASLSFETDSTRTYTEGATSVGLTKPIRRVVSLTFDQEPTDEALANMYELQMRLGITGQLYFVWDSADTVHLQRRSFQCALQKLSALQFPFYAYNAVPFALVEEL